MKNTNEVKETIEIQYTASVYTPDGWLSVNIEALAEKTSEKMAKVVEVLYIDDCVPEGYTSRTGAKRQTYNASGVACREVNKIKRLSACKILCTKKAGSV